MKVKHFLFALIIFAFALGSCRQNNYKNAWPGITPDSVHPSPWQIAYQKKEKIAFVHFGMNTFTNKEWGTGKADPSLFNPTDINADQWAKTLSENGFKTLILTAKHHDGFCLWPSRYTDYDIANSPFKNGNGDIVKEVSEACRKYHIDFGIYLSPWDRHEKSYGTPAYNDFYVKQLRELLTQYGRISEVWFDGAKGKNAKDMHYDFKHWFATVRKFQPDALIFSDKGPDIRWIGNENGFAGKTNWSTIDRSKITIGKAGQGNYLNHGEKGAPDWVVGECDVSIRPGWFYHPKENDQLKPVSELTNIYLKSVGRNGTLLLNIPPDRRGQLHPTDVKRLNAFTDSLHALFDDNLADHVQIEASSAGKLYPAKHAVDQNWSHFWIAGKKDNQPTLTLHFDQPVTFNLLMLQEYIPIGQRISKFSVAVKKHTKWQTIARETTVGYKRILSFDKVTTDSVRLTFEGFTGRPAISNIGIYHS